jgi:formate dehydrogenase
MQSDVIPIIPADAARLRKRERPRGRQTDAAVRDELQQWLGEGLTRRELLVEHLHVINDRLGCLPAPQLVALAALMKLPQAEVFEVASFYHHFEIIKEAADGVLPPLPGLRVRVCDGLACALAGGDLLRVRLAALLGPQVQVIAAPCVGRCETAPVAVVHQNAVTHATAEAVWQALQAGQTAPAATAHIDLDAYRAQGGYDLLRDCMAGARDPLQLIGLMEGAGLRGLGGAGFPAGRKWRIVRAQPAPRLMAVNLDEGEPGTFKDRVLLETDPHRFIEGLWIAAWAVGVSQVTVYLRDEYHGCREMLLAELARLRADPPAPGLPEIVLRRGAGAYICGEESAMIESIEGRRGLPRLRPPYVAERGLFGRPTLVHNLETLYWVRELVERGAAWFASQGRHGRQGLRRFSVSGRVCAPGVKLAPAGITLRELVDEHCGGMLPGHRLYAYLPGGASGGILPERLAGVPLDFDTLQPHGAFIGSAAVIVLSQHDSAAAAARNLMRFFAHESCGQCTPCRAGTAKAVTLMDPPRWDAPLLGELGQVMRDASICGLGQAAPNAFDSVLKYFPHEVQV